MSPGLANRSLRPAPWLKIQIFVKISKFIFLSCVMKINFPDLKKVSLKPSDPELNPKTPNPDQFVKSKFDTENALSEDVARFGGLDDLIAWFHHSGTNFGKISNRAQP